MTDVGEDGSIVEYGINGFALKAYGTTEKFEDGGAAKHTQYIHRVRSTSFRKMNDNDDLFSLLGFIKRFNAGNALHLPLR